MAPMGVQQQAPPPPPHHHHHHANGSLHGGSQGTGQVLDYLENQVRGLDVNAPPVAHYGIQHQYQVQPQVQAPPAVPYTQGPPSMLSALDEMGVRGVERRVITLPPIIQPGPGYSSRREDGPRGGPRLHSQSSSSTNRSGGGAGGPPRGSRGYRDASPPRRGILREYSDESDWESRRGRAPPRGWRNERGSSSGRSRTGSRPRARSRDDLMEEVRSRPARRERSLSPPRRHRSSWSSDDSFSRRKRKGEKEKAWPELPPSYFSLEHQAEQSSRRNYNLLSVR